jgi:hypothetical protein
MSMYYIKYFCGEALKIRKEMKARVRTEVLRQAKMSGRVLKKKKTLYQDYDLQVIFLRISFCHHPLVEWIFFFVQSERLK